MSTTIFCILQQPVSKFLFLLWNKYHTFYLICFNLHKTFIVHGVLMLVSQNNPFSLSNVSLLHHLKMRKSTLHSNSAAYLKCKYSKYRHYLAFLVFGLAGVTKFYSFILSCFELFARKQLKFFLPFQ